jgi:flagellar motor switch protein FliM
MDKVLNQEQIDAMVRAARGGQQASAPVPSSNVTAWDATRAGQIGSDQVRAISLLHESFARNLTNSLGAFLRVVFEATLVSAEHLAYQEYLQRCPELSYIASFRLMPLRSIAVLQLDLGAAFPIVELMLGGQGKENVATRETTEIEEQILESVVRIILRELQTSWQKLALEFVFDQRHRGDQVQRLMRPEEKILSLSFEMHVAETRGSLNLAIPAVVSNALLRKMSADWVYQLPEGPSTGTATLRERLLECGFPFSLEVTEIPVRARDVLNLAVGDLLVLERAVSSPALAVVAGEGLFTATVGRRGTTRVAQIVEALHTAVAEEKR